MLSPYWSLYIKELNKCLLNWLVFDNSDKENNQIHTCKSRPIWKILAFFECWYIFKKLLYCKVISLQLIKINLKNYYIMKLWFFPLRYNLCLKIMELIFVMLELIQHKCTGWIQRARHVSELWKACLTGSSLVIQRNE